MKTAPKKIQNQAIKMACLYRDAALDEAPSDVMFDVTDLRKEAFEALVSAMECTAEERLMVHETLSDIVRKIPRKPFTLKRLLHHGT